MTIVYMCSTKGDTQIRTGDKSFAGFCLTTWPCRRTYNSRTKKPYLQVAQYDKILTDNINSL